MYNRLFLILLGVPFAACSSTTQTPVGFTTDAGPEPDAGITDAPTGGTLCSSARDQLLLPIDKVSTGVVSVLSDADGKKTIYVDASAGGLGVAAKNPRVYVDLGAGTRVAVTTNSGDAGVGTGGAAKLAKAFASVTPADIAAATPAAESFFDADCNAKLDPTGAAKTTFADWYDYDETTNIPTPKPNVTFVVQGGTGRKYKVAIKAYDALPDGGTRNNTSTGFYLLEVTEAAPE
jgi:hypothetical protein